MLRVPAVADLVFIAFGDVHSGDRGGEVFNGVAGLIKAGDLAFCNLEGPASERGTPISKLVVLRSSPRLIDGLAELGVRVVSFANNHCLDYGVEAFLDTLNRLERRGIRFIGAGKNLEEALRAEVVEAEGVRVAFLAFASFFDLGFQATDMKPGLAPVRVDPLFDPPHINGEDLEVMKRAIRQARSEADIVIVSHHWGVSMSRTLTTYQCALGRLTIDAGADLVIGTHPHVLQGIETYKGRIIIYSLGNFVFAASPPWFSSETRESVIMRAEMARSGIAKLELLPVLSIEGIFPRVLTRRDAKWHSIYKRLEDLSRTLNTTLRIEGDSIVVEV